MTRDVAHAIGTLIDAALERKDVRRISSVFRDNDDDGTKCMVVVVEYVSPAYDDVALIVRPDDVEDLSITDLEKWADKLLAENIGHDEEEEEYGEPEGEDDDEEEEDDDD